MKKQIIILVGLVSLVMINCSRFEEGPAFSLMSKKKRLVREWTLDTVVVINYQGSIDYTYRDLVSEYVFNKDKTGSALCYYGGNCDIEWQFSGDKYLKIRYNKYTNWTEWEKNEILRLTEKELWLKLVRTEIVGVHAVERTITYHFKAKE